MVEFDKSRQATPVTFDRTGINYPQQWEVKYQELRNAECLQRSILNQPLTFYQQTNSFILPAQTPAPRFTPPLVRSTSMASYSNAWEQAKSESVSASQSTSTSFTGLYET